MVAYVQQHDGEDFTSPPGLGRACSAWCDLTVVSGRHPSMAAEDVLQLAALLPPSGSNGMVCSWYCVRSATGFSVEAVPSRVVVILSDLVYGCFVSAGRPYYVCHGETTLVTS